MIQFALIALVAALGSGLGGYLYGVGVGEDKEIAKQATLELVAEKAAQTVANQTADAILKIKGRRDVVVQKATHEIQTNTIYADCKHSPSMLGTINEALTGRGADPSATNLVPASSAVGEPGLRSDNAAPNRLGFHLPSLPTLNRH